MIKRYNKSEFTFVAKGTDEKWNWIYDELYNIFTYRGLATDLCLSPDDMVQETAKFILERLDRYGVDIADEIYRKKDKRRLIKLVKERIVESSGESWFDTEVNFRRYKKVHAICEKYNIEEDANNAWVIWGIINEKTFSIALIQLLLQKKKPKTCSLDQMKEEQDAKLLKALRELDREYAYEEAVIS